MPLFRDSYDSDDESVEGDTKKEGSSLEQVCFLAKNDKLGSVKQVASLNFFVNIPHHLEYYDPILWFAQKLQTRHR